MSGFLGELQRLGLPPRTLAVVLEDDDQGATVLLKNLDEGIAALHAIATVVLTSPSLHPEGRAILERLTSALESGTSEYRLRREDTKA